MSWFEENWRYLLLVLVGAVTVFLVVLAFNRPDPTFAPSTPRSPIPTSTPTPSATTPAPTVTPTPTPTVVAFLGDSYTAGLGATASTSRWSTVLAETNGWVEVNLGGAGTGYGTPGDAGGPYGDRVADVVAAQPNVVIVSGGRFDYSGTTSRETVTAAIAETFASLRSGLPDAQIIAMGPIWDASASPARLAEIANDVRTAVEAVGGTFADIGQPLAAQPDLIGADGILPNDAGYAKLSATITAAVAPLILAAG